MIAPYVRSLSHVDYWRRLDKYARRNPTADTSPRQTALHEAGHAVAAVALGGRPLHIRMGGAPDVKLATAHCTAEMQLFPTGDDLEWSQAALKWAGAVAADTLAGAWGDLERIRAFGRPYLVDRHDGSAFAGARHVVYTHYATIERLADVFLARGEVDVDTLTELTGHIRPGSRG